jgi:putative transposase
MIEKNHKTLSIRRQSTLLEVNRSTLYYEPIEAVDDTSLANDIYEVWLGMPFYGYRRVTAELCRRSYLINEKRVLRLMREMKVQAL